ncbi:MAG: hypothetical protein IPG96_05365 [Proteobacteria bacterium]|nr:hypothetical protein [Pseudomonadota bacterium]
MRKQLWITTCGALVMFANCAGGSARSNSDSGTTPLAGDATTTRTPSEDGGASADGGASSGPDAASTGIRAEDAELVVQRNASGSGQLRAGNGTGGALRFLVVTLPSHGTLTLTDSSTGEYSYAPVDGFWGKDQFTFVAIAGTQSSNIATIEIKVNTASRSQLVVISPEDVVRADRCGEVEIRREGEAELLLSATTVKLSGPLAFHTGSCTSPAANQVALAAGQTSTTVYVSSTTPGDVMLTAEDTAGKFDQGLAKVTIAPGPIVRLTLSGPGRTSVGACTIFHVYGEDAYGNPSDQNRYGTESYGLPCRTVYRGDNCDVTEGTFPEYGSSGCAHTSSIPVTGLVFSTRFPEPPYGSRWSLRVCSTNGTPCSNDLSVLVDGT